MLKGLLPHIAAKGSIAINFFFWAESGHRRLVERHKTLPVVDGIEVSNV